MAMKPFKDGSGHASPNGMAGAGQEGTEKGARGHHCKQVWCPLKEGECGVGTRGGGCGIRHTLSPIFLSFLDSTLLPFLKRQQSGRAGPSGVTSTGQERAGRGQGGEGRKGVNLVLELSVHS